ncbi:uncharacterized protein [Cardiocondyla obscurior]|uniref:uncharacterized protein isoform X2 n=1 Tax=Cardiocondyla obscurior TaxID=286306 RepID=UPI0039658331
MSCYCLVLIFGFYSISAYSLEILEKVTDDYHECARPCTDESALRKTCVYHFVVTESYGATSSFYNQKDFNENDETSPECANATKVQEKSLLAINGKSPGPAIQVCLGDAIEVFIYNKLESDEVAFHWHGIRQKNSNYMDGVSMITQCPILPFSGFRYKIYPESTGTYFYHAHSVSQQGDGLYGSLTVRGPRDKDLSWERTLILSSRPPTPLTRHASLYPPTPGELLVNGQARQALVRVKYGFRYLLRLVNANAYDCPILLSTHGHSLQILAADSNPVQSMTGTNVVLFPGERLDAILIADQTIGKYVLDLQGLRECRSLRQEAYIFYEDAALNSHAIRTPDAGLKNGALRIPQINGMSFKYPPSPILSQPENTLEKSVCSLDKRSSECTDTPLFCECLQLLQISPQKTIEIILINEGFGGNASYTFHLHGYNASIIGRDSFEQPLTKNKIISMDLNGKIRRNFINPVRKDTFVVPNKGYIILRFYTDNLGYWLWEVRSTALYPPLLGPGMQFLMRVGLQRNLPVVPIEFPSCGNNKGMDLLFENS